MPRAQSPAELRPYSAASIEALVGDACTSASSSDVDSITLQTPRGKTSDLIAGLHKLPVEIQRLIGTRYGAITRLDRRKTFLKLRYCGHVPNTATILAALPENTRTFSDHLNYLQAAAKSQYAPGVVSMITVLTQELPLRVDVRQTLFTTALKAFDNLHARAALLNSMKGQDRSVFESADYRAALRACANSDDVGLTAFVLTNRNRREHAGSAAEANNFAELCRCVDSDIAPQIRTMAVLALVNSVASESNTQLQRLTQTFNAHFTDAELRRTTIRAIRTNLRCPSAASFLVHYFRHHMSKDENRRLINYTLDVAEKHFPQDRGFFANVLETARVTNDPIFAELILRKVYVTAVASMQEYVDQRIRAILQRSNALGQIGYERLASMLKNRMYVQ